MAARWRMVIAVDKAYKYVSSARLIYVGRDVFGVRSRLPVVAAKVAVRIVLS